MDIVLSPELHEIIVAVARKAVDDRLQEFAMIHRDLEGLKAVVSHLLEAHQRAEERMARMEERMDRIEATVAELVEAQAQTAEEVRELAAAQARTEKRVEELAAAQARTEEEVRELAAAQARTEEEVKELAAAQARTEKRVEELAAAQAEMRAEMREMIEVQKRIIDRLGELRGWQVETRYRERAKSYFGSILRRVRVVSWDEVEERLETQLTDEELQDLFRLDLLVAGRPRRETWVSEAWLAVEASAVVDERDVARARRRARILRSAGFLAIPTVAGEGVSDNAWAEAIQHHVLVIEDGTPYHWEEALQAAISEMQALREEGSSEAGL